MEMAVRNQWVGSVFLSNSHRLQGQTKFLTLNLLSIGQFSALNRFASSRNVWFNGMTNLTENMGQLGNSKWDIKNFPDRRKWISFWHRNRSWNLVSHWCLHFYGNSGLAPELFREQLERSRQSSGAVFTSKLPQGQGCAERVSKSYHIDIVD